MLVFSVNRGAMAVTLTARRRWPGRNNKIASTKSPCSMRKARVFCGPWWTMGSLRPLMKPSGKHCNHSRRQPVFTFVVLFSCRCLFVFFCLLLLSLQFCSSICVVFFLLVFLCVLSLLFVLTFLAFFVAMYSVHPISLTLCC